MLNFLVFFNIYIFCAWGFLFHIRYLQNITEKLLCLLIRFPSPPLFSSQNVWATQVLIISPKLSNPRTQQNPKFLIKNIVYFLLIRNGLMIGCRLKTSKLDVIDLEQVFQPWFFSLETLNYSKAIKYFHLDWAGCITVPNIYIS